VIFVAKEDKVEPFSMHDKLRVAALLVSNIFTSELNAAPSYKALEIIWLFSSILVGLVPRYKAVAVNEPLNILPLVVSFPEDSKLKENSAPLGWIYINPPVILTSEAVNFPSVPIDKLPIVRFPLVIFTSDNSAFEI